MDLSFVYDIDPGWLEVVLTAFGLIVSITLGYQWGRREHHQEHGVKLSPQQTMDLVRIYQRGLNRDIACRLQRDLRRREDRRQKATEDEYEEMRREMKALAREHREMTHSFRTPIGRLDVVLAEVHDLEDADEEVTCQELRRIGSQEIPIPEKLERMEKVIWERELKAREKLGLRLEKEAAPL